MERVERATIFLASSSFAAAMAARKAVRLPNPPNHGFKVFMSLRKSRYTPAVTKVEECTKEDTGVGAAIAAGSHLLKGSCALLVKHAKTNINER